MNIKTNEIFIFRDAIFHEYDFMHTHAQINIQENKLDPKA